MTPDSILREDRRRAQAAARDVGAARLRALLKRAQADLARRLREAEGLRGPGRESFTAVRARVLLRQVEEVLRALQPGMRSLLLTQAGEIADRRARDTVAYLRKAERLFTGSSAPLPIREALVLDRATRGAEASALRRIASDPEHPSRPGVLDRYSAATIGKFEQELQLRALAGKPWAEVRDSLVEASPFLRGAPAHWAERIVRTEAMNASNAASLEAMREADDQLGGGTLKILCAAFDSRTAADSYAVHGQVRRLSEPFNDWTHAYAHPPNRSNDREVVVPHRIDWPIPPGLRPRSDGEVAARWRAEGRKGSPPPRPKMSTIDFNAERRNAQRDRPASPSNGVGGARSSS